MIKSRFRRSLYASIGFLFLCPAFPAHASQELFRLSFNDGSLEGFQTYLEGGSCTLSNLDDQLLITIDSCGSLDYANQVYRDGFSLERGQSYRFSFDVSCDTPRDIIYRLQLNGGDYHAYLFGQESVDETMRHISVDWSMEEADPAPRLAFNLGRMENMTTDPGVHTILIDNVTLEITGDTSSVAASDEAVSGADASIGVNQVGYLPADGKCGILRFSDTHSPTFQVLDEADQVVYEGEWNASFYDAATDAQVCRGDFTDLSSPGTYRIKSESDGAVQLSAPFRIDDQVFSDLFAQTFRMLSLQRCGVEVTGRAQDGTDRYSHGTCHSTPALIYGTHATKDVSGGWHDAGDYGRYVVSGAKTVADLFWTYQTFQVTSDALGIPESGNGIPDVLDEARFELEWLLKMQDSETGGVYHKVTCRSFPGVVWPEEETDQLVLSPISLAATEDFAAVMARASVLYYEYDADFSNITRNAALRAWEYGKGRIQEGGFHNPQNIVTGEYPDEQLEDEYLWAAAELYLAGLLDEAEVRSRIEGCSVGIGWDTVGGYGLWDLALATGDVSSDLKQKAGALVLQDADRIKEAATNDGYYMALGSNYPWGSNMDVANNGIKLLLAHLLTGDPSYLQLASLQRDYLLGMNALGYCFVSGFGTRSPLHPHHRPSQVVGSVMPGMLSGGPDNGLHDPTAQALLQGKAPALCYVDDDQSYSTNEVTVYWNSPLIALLAGLTR